MLESKPILNLIIQISKVIDKVSNRKVSGILLTNYFEMRSKFCKIMQNSYNSSKFFSGGFGVLNFDEF